MCGWTERLGGTFASSATVLGLSTGESDDHRQSHALLSASLPTEAPLTEVRAGLRNSLVTKVSSVHTDLHMVFYELAVRW